MSYRVSFEVRRVIHSCKTSTQLKNTNRYTSSSTRLETRIERIEMPLFIGASQDSFVTSTHSRYFQFDETKCRNLQDCISRRAATIMWLRWSFTLTGKRSCCSLCCSKTRTWCSSAKREKQSYPSNITVITHSCHCTLKNYDEYPSYYSLIPSNVTKYVTALRARTQVREFLSFHQENETWARIRTSRKQMRWMRMRRRRMTTTHLITI